MWTQFSLCSCSARCSWKDTDEIHYTGNAVSELSFFIISHLGIFDHRGDLALDKTKVSLSYASDCLPFILVKPHSLQMQTGKIANDTAKGTLYFTIH